MFFKFHSDSDPIISKVMISTGARDQTMHVRVKCASLSRYLRLKQLLGEKHYYDDEGKLSILSDEYSLSLTSRDYKLIKYFIAKICLISPEFHERYSARSSSSDEFSKATPYASEADLPKWHKVVDYFDNFDAQKHFVWFKTCNSSGGLVEIRFIFQIDQVLPSTVCIQFKSFHDANTASRNIHALVNIKLDVFEGSSMWLFSAKDEDCQEFKLAICALNQIDASIDRDLIECINQFMPANDQIDLSPTSRLCRFHPTRPSSLINIISAVKNQPKSLKKVLDSLGDLLLTQVDDPQFLFEESESAIDHLLYLNKTDPRFKNSFRDLYQAQFRNRDDLKYILKKRMFHFHFLYSDNAAKWKEKHLGILRQIVLGLYGIFYAQIPFDREPNETEVEALRKKLLQTKVLPGILKNRVGIALMILSKYYPINPECYITLEKIEPQERVFTTTGFQFNLKALNEYNETRSLRNDLGETKRGQLCILPNNRCAVDEHSQTHITSLSLGAIYTNNDSNFLEEIYDAQFYKRSLQIGSWALSLHSPNVYRLAAVATEDSERLRQNLAFKPVLQETLDFLLTSGLSIEQFARLDTNKQLALGHAHYSVHYPQHLSGLDFDGLVSLNHTQIKEIFMSDGEDGLNHSSIDELNQAIQRLIMSSEASQRNQNS